ncbi:DUF1294 domain-containing protein [Methanolobus sp.]|uniref:DUF1294 domain-containing protein n=1 Tax=Methanolobus sp. TaxID=1874737 RepID=UPI0025F4EA0A|nr:DUF1294 domain-containing protein [Methanolobus sp.]
MDTSFIFFTYLMLVNLAGFAIMGIDKKKAKKNEYRIPEKTLFMWAIVGGSIGSIIGMYFFRHKTRHLSFQIGMPLILLVQIYIFIRFMIPLYVLS